MDSMNTGGVTLVQHPLVAGKLTILRKRTTLPDQFRRTVLEIAPLLLAEASRHWQVHPVTIETPLAPCAGAILAAPVVLVPILRAGLGLLDGMLPILPDASVGHIGLYRDETTFRPVSYYSRFPANIAASQVLLLDPMLATGHSASEAVTILKANGATQIQFACLVACPAGIGQLQKSHPDVPIFAAAIDPELNEFAYIVPGLGDAGDRYFGTI